MVTEAYPSAVCSIAEMIRTSGLSDMYVIGKLDDDSTDVT